jgi:hypothetical protein
MMEILEDVDLCNDLALVAVGHEGEVQVFAGKDLVEDG